MHLLGTISSGGWSSMAQTHEMCQAVDAHTICLYQQEEKYIKYHQTCSFKRLLLIIRLREFEFWAVNH